MYTLFERGNREMNNDYSVYSGLKELNPSETGKRAAIYCRLSKDDDEREGESASIQNQKALLEDYCSNQGWEVTAVYIDDGYTGLNMNRPDLMRMLKAVERRQIDIVLTKDLSRLSRNYVEFGQLTEQFFPKNGIRYIAVNDSVDTAVDGALDMTPFRAVVNQMYSADTSKKVHSSYLTKARNGQFTGCLAPFGYKKSEECKNKLEPDDDTAPIVKLIYDLAKDGRGPNHIRRRLEDLRIPCPAWWNRQKGLRDKTTKFERENPETGRFIWDFTTIKEILENPVYIGSIASQKQVYKFKAGWIRDKKPHEWLVVDNMHEPIVSQEVFELVQEKVKTRKRPDAWGNYSIFAGLLKCGQCGSSMNVRRANQKGKDRIYTCSKYNKFGVAHCSQHRMKYDVLYNLVLEQIRSYAKKALENETDIAGQLMRDTRQDDHNERALVEKAIAEDSSRLATIDKIIGKLYEDMIAERISAENFNALLEKTQSEQGALKNRLEHNKARIADREQERQDTSRWIKLIREYADIQELDAATLNQLIKKILIHEDMDGSIIRQTVEIHFNFKTQADKYKLIRE
jgi:DNA invertase Pin-like site-specific DNA recombinase